MHRLCFGVFALSIVAAIACGARTGLPVPPPPEETVDAGPDAPADAPPDVVDAPPDAPPDVVVPPINACADAGITYIYLMTAENILYSFYPPEGVNGFNEIGMIDCLPTDPSATPFSMGVSRTGTAYVVFTDGELFAVSTKDASCAPTPYVPTSFGSAGERTFGMGFSADVTDPGETLFVASTDDFVLGPTAPETLGTVDVTTFQLSPIHTFPVIVGSAELTGTGDGRLYGFGVDMQVTDAGAPAGTFFSLLEIDKANADITETPLQMSTGTEEINDWAFAFWGGRFYFFTTSASQSAESTVSIYTPGVLPAKPVAAFTVPNSIVGAGVSTCAPEIQ